MTENQINMLRRYLFDDRMAVSDAARLLGVSEKRAYYQAKKMGWSVRQRKTRPKKLRGINPTKVRQRLDAEKTFKEVAEELGVSKQRIAQIAADLGIKRKPGRRKATT